MEKIKIITDTACDLPKELVEELNIEMMSFNISIGGEEYLDKQTIHTEELLDKMKECDDFPSTAQITPQRFYEKYKQYVEEGYKVICMPISSKMSGTYQSACIAKQMIEEDGHGDKVEVIDTLAVTGTLALLAYKTAKLIESGMSFDEVVEEVRATVPKIKCSLGFETLENLIKGGRLPKAAGAIMNALNLKLLLSIEEGKMDVSDKVRGSKKAVKKVVEKVNNADIDTRYPIMVTNIRNEDMYQKMIEGIDNKEDIMPIQVGCAVAVHAGEGAIAAFYIEK